MSKPAYPPLILDIMLDGRFICQLRYKGYPFPKIIDGKVPVYSTTTGNVTYTKAD